MNSHSKVIAMNTSVAKDPVCSSPIVNDIDWEYVGTNSKEYTFRSAYGMSVATVYNIKTHGALLEIHPEGRLLTFGKSHVPEAFAYARRLKEQYRYLRG